MSTIGEGRQKNKRKESRGVGTQNAARKSPDGKLTPDFDEQTGRAVGEWGKKYNNALHEQVRDIIDPTTVRWSDVPRSAIDIIYKRILVSICTYFLVFMTENM